MSKALPLKPNVKIGDAAKILGVSIDTLRRWEKKGKLEAVRTPGGTRLYNVKALQKIIGVPVKPRPTPSLPTSELLKKATQKISPLQPVATEPVVFSPVIPNSFRDLPSRHPLLDQMLKRVQHDIKQLFPLPIPPKNLLYMGGISFTVAAVATGLFLLYRPFLQQAPKNKEAVLSQVAGKDGLREVLAASNAVLAASASAGILEINTNVEIGGTLNGLTLIATSGSTLNVLSDVTLDQDVSTASTPTFESIILSNAINQIGGNTITFPSATTTLVGTDTKDTLTNKTMSGSSNTFTDIPNSALTNSKITITPGTNLTGGGTVELGKSITISAKDSPSFSGQVLLSDGTASAPGLAFANDTNTGLYRIGADNIALITGGTATQGISIDASGNVGLGTITPTTRLHVVGTGNITGAVTIGGTLGVTGATTLSSTLAINGNTTIGDASGDTITFNADAWTLSNDTNVTLSGGVNGLSFDTTTLSIDASNDRVGIGTTSPNQALEVIGRGRFSSTLQLADGTNASPAYTFTNDTNTGLYRIDIDRMSFVTGGASRLSINSSGNVGIGTTDPATALEVIGAGTISDDLAVNGGDITTSATTFNLINATATTLNIGGAATSIIAGATNGAFDIRGNLGIGTSSPGARLAVSGGGLIGYTGTEAAPVNGLAVSGNVGIGTTSPNYKLEIVGNTNITGNLTVGGTTSPASAILLSDGSSSTPALSFASDTDTGLYRASSDNMRLVTGGTDRIIINSAGNVGIGVTSPITTLHVGGTTTVNNRILASLGSIDIGSAAIRFGTGFFDSINATNLEGTLSPSAGSTQASSWTINSDNATNDAEDASLAFERGTGADTVPNAVLGWDSSTHTTTNGKEFDLNSRLHITGTIRSYSGILLEGFENDITTATNEHLAIMPQGTGNVGIGTTGPGSTLQINGNTVIGFGQNTTAAPSNGLAVSGNVGIGSSSPSYKLEVVGTSHFTGNSTFDGVLQLADGTNAAPSLTFLNDTNTGLYRIDTDRMSLVTGGASALTINSSGNVGIGTTAPTNLLSVAGAATIGSGYAAGSPTAPSNGLIVQGNVGIGTSTPNVALQLVGATALGWAGAPVITAPTSGLAVNGNVGIGTTVAGASLQVNGNVVIGYSSASTAGPTNGLAVLGNVGIGTTSPQYNLHVVGTTNISGTTTFNGTLQLADGSLTAPSLAFTNDTDTGLFRFGSNGLALTTGGSGVNLLSLNSSGNVGIGTTGPAQALEVRGTARIGSNLTNYIEIAGAAAGSATTITSGPGAVALTLTAGTSGNSDLTLSGSSNTYATFNAESLTIPTTGADRGIAITASGTNADIELRTGGGNGVIYQALRSTDNTAFFMVYRNTGDLLLQVLNNGRLRSDVADPATVTNWSVSAESIFRDFGSTIPGTLTITSGFSGQRFNAFGAPTITAASALTVTNAATVYIAGAPIAAGSATITNSAALVIASGNVGIGYTAPVQTLHVQGTEYISGNLGVGTSSPGAKLSVAGGGLIGYTGTQVAPSNGLAILGNVGIGTTSPAYNLQVVGTTNITGASTFGGALQLADGTNSAPSLTFANDTNTGLYRIDTDRMSLVTGGASALTINSSGNVGIGNTNPGGSLIVNSGNVGIGTNSPVARLDVRGAVLINQTSLISDKVLDVAGEAQIDNYLHLGTGAEGFGDTQSLLEASHNFSISAGAHSVGIYSFPTRGNGTNAGIFHAAYVASARIDTSDTVSNVLQYWAGNPAVAGGGTITNSYGLYVENMTSGTNDFGVFVVGADTAAGYFGGNVGIGNSSPGASLQIHGNGVIGYGVNSVAGPTNGLAVFGNVGIGTTSPAYKLEVVGTAHFTGAATYDAGVSYGGNLTPLVDDTYDLGSNTLRWRDLYLGPGTMHIGTSTSDEYSLSYDTTNNRLGFNVNDSANAEIVFDSSGNVGIGTTGPTGILHVAPPAATSGNGAPILLTAQQGAATSTGGAITLTTGAGGATSGASGALTLTTGAAASNANTGAATLSTSNALGTGNAGSISITGGSSEAGQNAAGGSITITAGGSSQTPGAVSINGGDGNGANAIGGDINLNSGDGTGIFNGGNIGLTVGATGGGGGTQAGGTITLTAGQGNTTGAGGAISLTTGAGGSISGASGGITLASGTTTSGRTGDLTLRSGAATGGNAGDIFFQTNGTNLRMTVAYGGNVGIGTSTPGATLQIAGNSVIGFGAQPAVTAPTNGLAVGGNVGIGNSNPLQRLHVNQSETTSFIVSSAGNVGIGTTSPTAALSFGSTSTINTLSAGNLTLQTGAGTGSGAGGTLALTGGAGGATGTGGAITLTTGAGGGTSGNSGALSLTTGSVTSGTSGAITINPGAVGNAQTGGAVTITGGDVTPDSGGSGTTGSVTIRAGDVAKVANTNVSASGSVTITGGRGISNGTGGAVTIQGGPHWAYNGSLGGGGGLTLAGGDADTSAGQANGAESDGGTVTLRGGTGWSGPDDDGTGAGGTLSITGGTPGVIGAGGAITLATGPGGTTSGNSGDLTLRTGSITSGTAGNIYFQTNGTNLRMTVANGGNVGIGTSTPGATLQIAGNAVIGFGAQPAVTAPTNGLAVGGNVGIGTSNPSNKLSVVGGNIDLFGGNLGIGTSSPGARLAVAGGGLIGYSGTQAAPTNGLAVFGNVGIGTTSPTYNLQVVGTANITGALTVGGATSFAGSLSPSIDDTYDLGTSALRWRDLYLGPSSLNLVSTAAETTTARNWKIGIEENGSAEGNLRFALTGSQDALNINPSGNVGIGTTSPGAKLHLLSSSEQLRVALSSTVYTTFTQNSARLIITANGSTAGTNINSSNAGGTALALDIGNIAGGSGADSVVFGLSPDTNQVTSFMRITAGKDAANDWATISNRSGYMAFSTPLSNTVSERMRITSGGNIGIGTSIPNSTLQVNGNATIGFGNATVGTGPTNGLAVFGNVGIGTSSPAYNLQVVGTTNITGTSTFGGALQLADGTNAAPSLTFTNDTNTGLYRIDTDRMSFVTGGISRATIDNSGNVGIGTTGPTSKLAVIGSTTLGGAATDTITLTGSLNSNVNFLDASTGTAYTITGSDATGTNAAGGNLTLISGAGTGSGLGGTLTLAAGTSGTGSAGSVLLRGGEDTGSVNGGAITLRGGDGGTTNTEGGDVTIRGGNASGAVGDGGDVTVTGGAAGTTTAGGAITITTGAGGSSSGLSGALTLATGTTTSGRTGDLTLRSGAATGGNAGDIFFQTNGANNRMTIAYGGNVGIGTSTPGATLQIAGNSVIGFGAAPAVTGPTNGLAVGGNVGIGNSNPLQRFHVNQSETTSFVVASSGNVGIGTTNPGAKLDVRGSAVFNEDGNDADFRIESDTNANAFTLDAGAFSGVGAFGFGTDVAAGGYIMINPTFTAAASNDGFVTRVAGTVTGQPNFNIHGLVLTSTAVEASSGNHTLITSLFVDTPSVAVGDATVSNTASIYIAGAMAATVSGANYALWVDSGLSRFDGNVGIGGVTSTYATTQIQGSGTGTALSFLTTDSSGTQRFAVLDNGNVGIGTTGPGAKLEIYDGNLVFDGTTNTDTKTIRSAKDAGTLRLQSGTTAGQATYINMVGLASTASIQFGTADTEKVRISESGNVGIGTSAPTSLFSVAGTTAIGLGYASGSPTAPTNGLIVQGNVGIGTSTPGTNLQVVGNAAIGFVGAPLSGPTNGLVVNGNVGIGTSNPTALFAVGSGGQFQVNSNGSITQAQSAVSGGQTALSITPGAHTAVTAESIAVNHAAQTLTITGAYATQRFHNIAQPTVTAASALAVTTGVTLDIGGAPTRAGSAQILNPRALRVAGNGVTFQAAATSSYMVAELAAHTLTLADSTSITSAESIAGLRIGQISYDITGNPVFTIVAGAIISTPSPSNQTNPTGPRANTVAGIVLGRENVGVNNSVAGQVYSGLLMQAHTVTQPQDNVTYTATPSVSGIRLEQITIDGQHATPSTWNDVAGISAIAPTFTNTGQSVLVASGTFGGNLTVNNLASTNYHNILSRAHTITLAETTQMTATPGVAGISIRPITVNQSGGAVTVNNAASLYVASALTAGSSVTLANNYALWVDAGTSRFDGETYLAMSSGNVGIGTSTPGATLQIAGNSVIGFGAAPAVTGPTNGLAVGGNVGIGNSNPLQRFHVNQSETTSFVVVSSGNVGIGTTSPTAALSFGSASTINTLAAGNLTLQTGAGTGAGAGGTLALTGGAGGATNAAGGAISLTAGTSSGSGAGAAVNITGGARAVGSSAAAGNVNITGGDGDNTSSTGGAVVIAGGIADGGGGLVSLTGGGGSAGNAPGGAASVVGGGGVGTGVGGALSLTAGQGGATGIGGAVTITAGAGGSSSGAGGALTITAGNATAGHTTGGQLSLVGGAPTGQGVTPDLLITGGAGSTSGGGADETGGNVLIQGGGARVGGSGSKGGDVQLKGGTGDGSGAGNAGGDVILTGGSPNTGAGAGGAISITTGAGGSTSGASGALTLASGTTSSGRTGDLTLRSGAATGGNAGDIFFQTNGTNLRMTVAYGGNVGIGTSTPGATLQIAGNQVIGYGGAPTAGPSNGLAVFGNMGVGTTSPNYKLEVIGSINVTGDIFKNGTAYNNPDYAFEQWATGQIALNADKPGASTYTGILSLEDTEAFVRQNFQLPRVASATGIFERGDILLEKVEEAYIHLFDLNRKIASNSAQLSDLSAALTTQTINLGSFSIASSSAGLTISSAGQNLLALDALGNMKLAGTITSEAGAFDIAEDYPATDESIEAGDVVAISETVEGNIEKSSTPYQNGIIGVISTKAGLHLGGEDGRPVALAGRVPVKVTTESGEIKAGDYLTSSSIPGLAMKMTRAGTSIGKALESFSCPTSDICQGTVLTFINVGWHDPTVYFTAGGLQQLAPDATPSLVSLPLDTEIASESAIASPSAQNTTYDIPNTNLSEDPLFKDLLSRIDLLSSRLDALQRVVVGTESAELIPASSSAELLAAIEDVQLNASGSAQLTGTLTVAGRTTLNDVGITGTLNAGLLTINGLGSSINTLAGDLKLQNLALGGIDILAGKIKIDIKGNIVSEGTITAKEVEAEKITTQKLVISEPVATQSAVLSASASATASPSAVLSASAGTVTIKAGQTSIDVETSALTVKSLVFVTPDKPIATSGKVKDATTVTISIPTPTPEDIKVNWWIIN